MGTPAHVRQKPPLIVSLYPYRTIWGSNHETQNCCSTLIFRPPWVGELMGDPFVAVVGVFHMLSGLMLNLRHCDGTRRSGP